MEHLATLTARRALTYIHLYIHTHMHACMHASMHTYIHVYILKIQITLKKTIQSKPVGKFEREIRIVSMAPKRHYKGTRKMIDGQIGISANLTKLLFQLLQMIHHISIIRTQAEGSPVNAFLYKIAELDRFTRSARPNSDVIKRMQTLNRSWAKQVGMIVHNHYLTNLNSIISTLKTTRASKDEMSRARYTALSWARDNFGRKLQNYTVSEFGTILRNLLLGRRGREPTRPFSVTSAAPLHRNQPVHTTSAVPIQRTFEGHTQTQSKTDAQLRQYSAHGTNSHSGNGAKLSW